MMRKAFGAREPLLNHRTAAVQAARAAGRVLRAHMDGGVSVRYKGPRGVHGRNLVTNVDRLAQRAILRLISRRFPGHRILAEETVSRRLAAGAAARSPYRWLIDPLDGTTNYAHRFPFFCVSIALEYEGRIVLGVVYDPVRRELFLAERGRGARLNGRPIRVTATPRLDRSLLVTGFSYDSLLSQANNFTHFLNFSLRTRGVRRTGSAALDLCYVAAGRFDGFWELKLSPWDVAAGGLIVQEAGGTVTDFLGRSFAVDAREILASNGRLHRPLLAVLAHGDSPFRARRRTRTASG